MSSCNGHTLTKFVKYLNLQKSHVRADDLGKLEKPDGLQWLGPENLPERIAHLQLDDLPGISRGIKNKLNKAMIWDIPSLYALNPKHG